MAMRKSRFTEEQIAHALRQAETGTPVTAVCLAMGVSEQTYYRRKTSRGQQQDEQHRGTEENPAGSGFADQWPRQRHNHNRDE